MNLSLVKTAVTSKVGRQILVSKSHSPAILFGFGVVGVVATTVLACRATLKLDEVLQDLEKDLSIADGLDSSLPSYTKEDHKHDTRVLKVRAAASVCKLYAPPVALGIVSIAALSGSHVILSRRNVALSAAYSAVMEGFKDYRKRVTDELGEEKDREFMYGVQEREVVEEGKNGPKVSTIKSFGSPSQYARIWDRDTSSLWEPRPESNFFLLKSQQNYMNQRLQAVGHVTLNEVHDALGLERTAQGMIVGWVKNNGDEDNYIDFGVFRGNDQSAFSEFMQGKAGALLLDFNVHGNIYDIIRKDGRRGGK